MVRLWQFGSIPVSLYWDEMAIWDDAQSIAATGQDIFNRSAWQPIFISYGDFKLPVYIWLTAGISFFVHDPLIGVRIVSLLAGLSMIPAVYLLTRNLGWSKHQSLVAATFMGLLPWSIHFSRVGFEAHLAAALVLWSLVCFLVIPHPTLKTKQRLLLLFISIFLATTAFYTYFSVRYVWPILIIVVTSVWWPTFRRFWFLILLGMVAWLVSLLPMFQADFYQASNQLRLSTVNVLNQPTRQNEVNLWRQRAGNSLWSRVLYSQETFIVVDLARNIVPFFSADYLFASGDTNLRHGNGYSGLAWWATLPLLIFGATSLWNTQRRLFIFLTIWWLIALVPAAVPQVVPHSLRSLNAVPVLPIVMAAGITWVWHWTNKKAKILFLSGTVACFLLEFSFFTWHYFSVYPRLSAIQWQDGYLQLAEYLSEQNEKQNIRVNMNDDRFFLYYLPVSGLGWEEIQELPSKGFKRYEIQNVQFEQQEAISDTTSLLVVPAGTKIAHQKIVHTIKGKTGETVFEVYEYNNKPNE